MNCFFFSPPLFVFAVMLFLIGKKEANRIVVDLSLTQVNILNKQVLWKNIWNLTPLINKITLL